MKAAAQLRLSPNSAGKSIAETPPPRKKRASDIYIKAAAQLCLSPNSACKLIAGNPPKSDQYASRVRPKPPKNKRASGIWNYWKTFNLLCQRDFSTLKKHGSFFSLYTYIVLFFSIYVYTCFFLYICFLYICIYLFISYIWQLLFPLKAYMYIYISMNITCKYNMYIRI
jgi:hypothetical protein